MLSVSEKNKLRNEFYQKYPKYLKAHKSNVFWGDGVKCIAIISLILFSIVWFGTKILGILKIITAKSFVVKISVVLILVLLAVMIILPTISLILKGKRRYRAMMIEKRFWKYITEEKNMRYTVVFDTESLKNKLVYDNINLEYEDI